MLRKSPRKPRGILHPRKMGKEFQYARYVPSKELEYFIEHYWIVRWDLREREPYISETLPHPSVHLVIEQGRSGIGGVHKGRFSRVLEGIGRVFGIKFEPGAFHSFMHRPLSSITNRTLKLSEVFGSESDMFEEKMLDIEEDAALVECAEQFLRARLPDRDENIELINHIIEYILTHRDITTVETVAVRFHMNKRSLQRLFSEYVGVSPKWVIKRNRLHEAAEQLAEGAILDLPKLALDLGYFDQAHFINDFKTIVGRPPAEYAKHITDV
jgi:AraC-like DNA-binding protein